MFPDPFAFWCRITIANSLKSTDPDPSASITWNRFLASSSVSVVPSCPTSSFTSSTSSSPLRNIYVIYVHMYVCDYRHVHKCMYTICTLTPNALNHARTHANAEPASPHTYTHTHTPVVFIIRHKQSLQILHHFGVGGF